MHFSRDFFGFAGVDGGVFDGDEDFVGFCDGRWDFFEFELFGIAELVDDYGFHGNFLQWRIAFPFDAPHLQFHREPRQDASVTNRGIYGAWFGGPDKEA